MIRSRFLSLAVAASTALLSGSALSPALVAAKQTSGQITVFAAASLTDAFKQTAAAFQYENPDATVTFNFAGSNTLRLQLDQGASADVFASADQTQMDLARQNGDLSGDPQVFAHNLLTIITPADNPQNIQSVCDLAKPGVKFVTAQPSVPVGQYTAEMLQQASAGPCGPAFQAQVRSNIVSLESDVKQVVSKVQLGEADAGVSYTTDVTPSVRSEVNTVTIPEELNVLATYPIATTHGNNLEGGQEFMRYVMSPIGQAVLAHWGFLPADTTTTAVHPLIALPFTRVS